VIVASDAADFVTWNWTARQTLQLFVIGNQCGWIMKADTEQIILPV